MYVYDLRDNAVEDLKERIALNEVSEIADTIVEIADNHVPILSHQLLDLAKNHLWLATIEPEI